MFSQTLLFILGGCFLGAMQLVVGIAIGAWLRRPLAADIHRNRQDMLRSQQIARRLQALADEMSSSAHEHRTQLDHASELLTADATRNEETLAELVVDVIGDIVRANQKLQAKLETAENRLEEQAAEIEAHISRSLTDPLTGLPNRREFDERLEERMAAWNRRGETFSLLLLDVDHFKKLNDEHGHLVGDQVLAAVARAMRRSVRREDAVARYGGEEFAILLPSTSLEQAVHVAEKVRSAMAAISLSATGREVSVTVSGGLAAIGANEVAESLIQRADAALYAAKTGGRNCAFVHDGAQTRSAAEFLAPVVAPAGQADDLIQLIHSPDAQQPPGDESSSKGSEGFGAYLQQESISPDLASTCAELRRFVEERSERQQEGTPLSRA